MHRCIQNKYDSDSNISVVYVIEENGMIFGEMARELYVNLITHNV